MMPKKANSGTTTIDLLHYLFGPGKRDEHTDPHLITGWDPDLPCPARHPDRMTLTDLARLLDAPVEALRGPKPAEHIWHVAVRNHPDDRTLSDAEWSEVATAMVHAARIAEHGDEHACRWIAVRHADDHIHIVATLARQDGRHPRLRGDIPALHAAARAFETAWGLTPMSPLDRTARRRPVTGEAEKAARRGLTETARDSLQRTVRQAAALAHGDTDFLDRLRDAGLRVRTRHHDDGTLLGYAVALPGDRADSGTRPVWFAGKTLAYDLSLPRVRERFTPLLTPAHWTRAEHRIREASALLARAGQDEGAGDVAALGDLLTAAAAHAPALVRDRIQAAADAFEQAARAPTTRSLEGRARAGWRASARALEQAPRAARGGGTALVLTLLTALVEAVEAAADWHRAQAFRAQAKAASQAAVLLREAAGPTGPPPSTTKPRTGQAVHPVRTARTSGRGLPTTPSVTAVPARPRPDPGRPSPDPGAPGPSRTR
ncbi:mobilization protein [Streptomyces sp. NPDC002057]|uniref:mobilization protein n=1 Tax=Streptomyces sp. NPDC002057 TaxID=3154664 RepID=UPI003328083F